MGTLPSAAPFFPAAFLKLRHAQPEFDGRISTVSAPGTPVDCSGTLSSLGYNAISAAVCTITATTGDHFSPAGLTRSPLANNGGPTLTQALPPGSIGIDAADNSACSATDQRGFKRPVFGGTALRCDIGAFELYRFGLRLPLVVR